MSTPTVDYAALAKQAGATDSQPPAQSGAVDYAALAKQAGATDSQPAPAQAGATQQPGVLDRLSDQPLTSYGAATEAGLANVAKGVVQGVSGMYNTVRHPIDTVKNLAAAPGNLASQAAQVPGAIKDINQSPDPAGVYGKVAAKTAGEAGGQALVAAAAPSVVRGAGKAIASVRGIRDIPAAISADTVGTFNTVAAKEGLPAVTATTARDAAGELSQNFIQRAKATYKVVDDAVGGDLKPVQEKITDLNKAIRVNQNVNPDLADKFTAQLAQQRSTLADLIEKAKANGVPDADKLMDAGDKDYSRGMAVKKMQSGIATASGQAKMGGHPHPGGFASQVDRFERTGVAEKGLGTEGTADLIENARTGLARGRTLGAVKTVGKVAAGAAGAGLVGKYAVDALSSKQ